MKNTMKNNTILKALTGMLFVTVLSVGVLGLAPFAHAQDEGDDDFGGDVTSSCCGSIAPSSIDYPSSYSDGTIAPSSIDYPSDYTDGTIAPSSIDYPSDYITPAYSSNGYATTGYATGGYATGGYASGGYLSGGYASGGYLSGYSYPVATTPSNNNIYAPSNTTVCSNGSNLCNTTTTITTPAPVIDNNNVIVPSSGGSAVNYVADACPSGYSGTYPNCYLPQPIVYQQPVQVPVYQQPLAYSNAPYVSLTQVPYTGLDLGFWGSIAYWGAFVLFALFAAYLIAVKRVQNSMANYLKVFLFGSEDSDEEVAAPVAVPAQIAIAAAPIYAEVAPQTKGDVIDSFIMNQINRARTA